MHRRTVAAVLCVALALSAWPARPSTQAAPARATWLWDPGPAFASPDTRASMFDFLERERISVVWAQVILSGQDLASAQEWRTLIGDASKRGIRIEALDGRPTYAIQEDAARRVLDAVLAYNEASRPDERFSGVHLDIEPYLLWSWRSKPARKKVLRRYLDLLEWCKQRIANEFPAMTLGADIPFWWQSKDDRTGRPIGDVEFGGVAKAASYHVIDMLENVGIMNYRNRAEGPNGMISLGEDLLAYADGARKARLWMGVETAREQSTPVWFVVGLPGDAMTALLERTTDISENGQFRGYKVSVFDDGRNAHLGLSLKGIDPDRPPRAFLEALAAVARTYGALKPSAETSRARLMTRLAADGEWGNPVARTFTDPDSGAEYEGVVASSAMPSTLSFDGLPIGAFRREAALAEQAFTRHPSYRGLAIHHYESFRRLVSRPAAAPVRPGAPPAGY